MNHLAGQLILVTLASTVSETDDDVFPLTPDSKHSGDPLQYVANISARAASSTPSRYHKQHHGNHQYYPFHLYRRAPTFQERHAFECMLGNIDWDKSSEDLKVNVRLPFCF
jgi:hypothetical protein